jgi:hypothetical protein
MKANLIIFLLVILSCIPQITKEDAISDFLTAKMYEAYISGKQITSCNVQNYIPVNFANYLVTWNSNFSYIFLNLLPSLITSTLTSVANIPQNTTIILEACIIGTTNCLVYQNSNLANLSLDSAISFFSPFLQPIVQCATYNVSALIYLGSVGCYQLISLPQLSM